MGTGIVVELTLLKCEFSDFNMKKGTTSQPGELKA